MKIRLLLVLLFILGAGTMAGQHVFLAQATSQAADDREDPEEPEAPSPDEPKADDPEPPTPADPDESMRDESDEPMPWKTDDAPSDTPEPAEDARSEDEEAEGKADDAEKPTADDPEMTDDAESETEKPAAEPSTDTEEPSAEPGTEPEMAEPSAEPEPTEPAAEEPMDEAAGDEAAIRQTIESFLAAFHERDAKALAAHWTEHGDFVTGSGERWQGQKQIEERYAAYFADTEDARLELLDTQIEVQSPSVAVETGIARVIVPGALPVDSEYKVIHVRTSAGWRIDSVRETALPGPPSREERLQELGWLVGQWVDHAENAEIKTTCRWEANHRFLVQTFRVFVEDRIDFEGTQFIGWDPRAETVRSWIFDSDGGFGAGRWTNEEGRWTVQTLYVLPDGRLGSSTNVYERLADDKISFSSVGRQVEGKILPNIDPVVVTRATEEQ